MPVNAYGLRANWQKKRHVNSGEKMKIRIGTRPSRLALRQVDEIKERLPHVGFDIVPIRTKGDKDKATPLSERENSDFFTCEIEEALLGGEIGAAVHSAKDLEETPPAGLVVAAMTRTISPFECLISRGGLELKNLPSQGFISREGGSGTLRSLRRLLIGRGRLPEKTLNVIMELGSTEAVKEALIAGLGVSILSRTSILREIQDGLLKEVPIRGLKLERDFYQVFHSRRARSPVCHAFIHFLKK